MGLRECHAVASDKDNIEQKGNSNRPFLPWKLPKNGAAKNV
jgi:hypothetical protein